MAKMGNITEPHCENCGKPLFGRADKRFCNDGCRNAFNRKKLTELQARDHDNLPEILRIIKRNYEVLKFYGEIVPGNTLFFPKDELEKDGVNTKFFTSIHYEEDIVWKFCFERGWRMDDTYCYIMDRPEQVEFN